MEATLSLLMIYMGKLLNGFPSPDLFFVRGFSLAVFDTDPLSN